MFKREDLLIGIVSVLLGIFVLVIAAGFRVNTVMDPAGPAGVPSILAWVILVIGVILLVGGFFVPKPHEDKKAKWAKEFHEAKPILYITVVCAAYLALLEYIGYLIATPLLIIGIMWVIKVRSIRSLLVTSVFTTIILFLVFSVVLRVSFPMGFLEGIL